MADRPPRNGVWLDLEDIWPPAESLVALQFASQADYDCCQAILWEDLELYHWDWPRALRVAVRKTDKHRFVEAGLRFTEHPVADRTEPYTEEEWRRIREHARRRTSELDRAR